MKVKNTFWLLTVALGLTAQTAHSANITVDGNDTATNCTLTEAIVSANGNANTGGCVGSGAYGADTITLQVDVTLATVLPQISSVITLEGGGHFISGNNNASVGSVLYVTSSGSLALNNATVKEGNKTGNGGGIRNYGTLALTNSIITGNTASGSGGGVCNENNGTATLTNSTISSNSAISRSGIGSGIYNEGTVTLNNSTVSNNSADNKGGGICNSSTGTVTLNNSTVSGNSASNMGGGIYHGSTGTVTLNNSTVSGNSASNMGGGILNDLNSLVTLRSSIISGNTAGISFGKEVYKYGPITAASFNVFGHSGETNAQAFDTFTPGASDVVATSDGGAPAELSVILSPLANNGGSTQTHALPAGSPAIDLDATCSTGLTTDQRGTARPATGCDAGAYEYIAPPGVNLVPVVYELLLRKKR